MAIWDLVAVLGQSHAQGVGTGAQAPVPNPALCMEWDNPTDGLVGLRDPSDTATDYDALTGSLLPMFAQQFTASSGRPLVMVRTAVGGTALLAANAGPNGDWSPTGTLFDDAIDRITDAAAAIVAAGHTVGRLHVLWIQGGRDARAGNDLHLYQAALEAMPGRLQTALSEPGLQMFIARSGTSSGLAGPPPPELAEVHAYQVAAAENHADIHMCCLHAVEFPDWGWQKFDGVHWTQDGYNHVGAEMATTAADVLGLSPPPPPVGPTVKSSMVGRMLLAAPQVPPDYTYTAPGTLTFTVPFGVSNILVQVVGAGQEGDTGTGLNPGDGGDGGYYADVTIAVTPGQQFPFTVGEAGNSGSGLEAGGDSSFDTLAVAPGGGSATSPVGDTTTAGSAGGSAGGGVGGDGGDAAPPLGGAGGNGGNISGGTTDPGNGEHPGGGGGGSDNVGSTPGTGAHGLVKITLDP